MIHDISLSRDTLVLMRLDAHYPHLGASCEQFDGVCLDCNNERGEVQGLEVGIGMGFKEVEGNKLDKRYVS